MRTLTDIVETALRRQWRDEFLREKIDRIDYPYHLALFFDKYISFNSVFAAGVSALSSAFHLRFDIFRDRSETVVHCSDRSAEVASRIFFAAEDEYSARRSNHRITHRSLAQAFLRVLASCCGCGDGNAVSLPNIGAPADVNEMKAEAMHRYGVARLLSEGELFEGIGFHIASEGCADQEFNILDTVLKTQFPEIVRRAQRSPATDGGDSYRWMSAHTSAEAEHFEVAVSAAAMAIDFYCGELPGDSLLERVYDGAVAFTRLQERMFDVFTESP